jgi:hypothetical protein
MTAARPRPLPPGTARRPRRRASRRARPGSRARSAARSGRRSQSMQSATPPFIVTASGCAPPIPPRPAVSVIVPGQRAAEPLGRDGGERLVGALQDALGADVDPRARRHLAVHRQPERLEPAELVPGRPLGTRLELAISTRGAHSWVRKTPTGLPDWTSSVSSSSRSCSERDDRVERVPAARRPAGAAVDDELGRDARRPRGRGCSSASASRPPAASPCRPPSPHHLRSGPVRQVAGRSSGGTARRAERRTATIARQRNRAAGYCRAARRIDRISAASGLRGVLASTSSSRASAVI